MWSARSHSHRGYLSYGQRGRIAHTQWTINTGQNCSIYRARTETFVEDKDAENTKSQWKYRHVFQLYLKEKKASKPEQKTLLAQDLKTFWGTVFRLRLSMYNKKNYWIWFFVISRIIKVSVSVISLSLRLRLLTFTSPLTILDITQKTSSNNCLI